MPTSENQYPFASPAVANSIAGASVPPEQAISDADALLAAFKHMQALQIKEWEAPMALHLPPYGPDRGMVFGNMGLNSYWTEPTPEKVEARLLQIAEATAELVSRFLPSASRLCRFAEERGEHAHALAGWVIHPGATGSMSAQSDVERLREVALREQVLGCFIPAPIPPPPAESKVVASSPSSGQKQTTNRQYWTKPLRKQELAEIFDSDYRTIKRRAQEGRIEIEEGPGRQQVRVRLDNLMAGSIPSAIVAHLKSLAA